MKSKYKAGDYIVMPDHVACHILAVMEGSEALFCLEHHLNSKNKLGWFTEYELDKHGFTLYEPDWQLWSTIAEGDIILLGNNVEEDNRKKVIARLDNLVMLSISPVPHDVQEKAADLADQLEQLTGSSVIKDAFEAGRDKAKPFITTRGAFRAAEEHWRPVDTLALMNWTLLRE